MKILLITDNHSLTGGAERTFFDLKTRLQALPNVNVLSLGYGQTASITNDQVILKAPKSNLAKLFWRFCFHPVIYYQLKKQIERFQPDVIHLHTIKNYTPTLMRAIKPYRVVHTMHDFSMICPTGQNIHQNLKPCAQGWHWRCFFKHHVKYRLPTYLLLAFLLLKTKRQLLKNIHAYTAPSPLLAAYMQKNGFKNVSYIPPFVSTPCLLSYELVKPGHFLFAGALGAHKGIHLLLNEIAIVSKSHPHCKIFIAGIGPEETDLKNQAKKLGITNNVVFVGWQPSLTTLMAQSQAVIFPSIGLEAFGLVITEAMSAGRAIIGANRGTIAWLVEDLKTGLLFDPSKPGDLANRMGALMANPHLAVELGKRAHHASLHQFDNHKTLQDLLNLYHYETTAACAI